MELERHIGDGVDLNGLLEQGQPGIDPADRESHRAVGVGGVIAIHNTVVVGVDPIRTAGTRKEIGVADTKGENVEIAGSATVELFDNRHALFEGKSTA